MSIDPEAQEANEAQEAPVVHDASHAPSAGRRLAGWTPMILVGFVVVHCWLAVLNLRAPNAPFGDVTWKYLTWILDGVRNGQWVGFNADGVYPPLALVPMLVSYLLSGFDWTGVAYGNAWLWIVSVLDLLAVLLVLRPWRGLNPEPRRAAAAWWWLGFQTVLGPIALGRIDTVVTAIALLGLVLLATRPIAAGVVLAIGAWVKVWPVALGLAAVAVLRTRLLVVFGALAASVVVLAVSVVLGGTLAVFDFVSQQGSRGLQVEAPVAVVFSIAAAAGVPGHPVAAYDSGLNTVQYSAPITDAVGNAMTPLLVIAVLALVVLALLATRRGAEALRVLPPVCLGVVVALIVFNKVGSPQFVTWIAAPVVFGLLSVPSGPERGFRTPALLALAIALLTQVIYPFGYVLFLDYDPWLVLVFLVRTALELWLLGWAVVALSGMLRTGADRPVRRDLAHHDLERAPASSSNIERDTP